MASKNTKSRLLRDMALSLEPYYEDFPIGNEQYRLKEPTESATCQWRDALMRGTRMDSNGKPIGIEGVSNTDALLVSFCLYKLDGDKEKLVEKKTIMSWPARVVKPIVEAVKEMAGLDEEDSEDLEALEEKKKELDQKIEKLRAKNNGQHSDEESLAKN